MKKESNKKMSETGHPESEEWFRSIYENSTIGIYRTTPDGRILLANPALVRMLGYSKFEDLSKRNLEQKGFEPNYNRSKFLDLMEKNNEVIGLESSWKRFDGVHIYIRESARAIRDADNKILYFDGSVEDITDRKKAEEKVKESEERFRSVFENSPLGKSMTGLDGSMRTNKAFREMLGYSNDEFKAKNWKEITYQDDIEATDQVIARLLKGKKQIIQFEKRYIHKNGSIILVEVRTTLLRNEQGEPLYFISTFTDITEQKHLEESLKKSEEKFRKAFTTSPDSININRLSDGMYVSINNGFTKILGYTEDLTIGKTSLELNIWNNPADRNILVKGLKKTGVVQNLEADFRCKDGSIISGMMSATIIDIDGVPHIISITRDITERKKFEMALRESEGRFRELIEMAPDGIILGSNEGLITGANSSLLQITGRAMDELIGSPVDILFSHEELNKVPLRYDLLKKGENVTSERNILRSDGHIVKIEMRTKMMPDGTYQSIFHDITKRKLAEEKLNKSNELYNDLVSKIPVGVYILRSKSDGTYAHDFASPRMAEMLNTTVAEMLEDASRMFKKIHPDDRDEFIRLNAYGIKFCVPFDWKGRFLIKKKVKWLHISSTPEPQVDGDIIWHGIIVDITEQKQAELALSERSEELQNELEKKRKAEIELKKSHEILEHSKLATLNLLEDIKLEMRQRKMAEDELFRLNNELEQRVKERTAQLEAANDELQAFAYSVSHDLRAPLRAIDGFSKFIVEDYGSKLDDEGRRLLGLIRTNTQKMDQLIIDILALSRVTRSEHRVSKIDMTKLFFSMLNEVALPEVRSKISIVVDSLQDTFADPTYIKQVWINLISNAIKFSSLNDRPEIKVGSYIENGFIVYFVKDNGVGFNPEYGHKLYGVFQRLHRADEFEGTGVGLAIVKRIVLRHGGNVWAEGTEGKGATFYFSLPVKTNNM